MIEIAAEARAGWTQVTVAGHEPYAGEAGDGGRVCAAVSAITRTAILGLQAVAEAFPDLVSITVTEE